MNYYNLIFLFFLYKFFLYKYLLFKFIIIKNKMFITFLKFKEMFLYF